jgi:hypothetical protein
MWSSGVSGEQPDDQRYSDEETERRFEALVRAVLSTPPMPLKDMPRKRGRAQG